MNQIETTYRNLQAGDKCGEGFVCVVAFAAVNTEGKSVVVFDMPSGDSFSFQYDPDETLSVQRKPVIVIPQIIITPVDDDLVEVAVSMTSMNSMTPTTGEAILEEVVDWAYEAHDLNPVADEFCYDTEGWATTLFVADISARREFIGDLVVTLLAELDGRATITINKG